MDGLLFDGPRAVLGLLLICALSIGGLGLLIGVRALVRRVMASGASPDAPPRTPR